ncbi:hypothetical protein ABZ816_10100 [Actinosynnema sp. NPDC047251]|uniref:AbiEi antitoxin C-terminal domain-containing protein n=1 Tax=Saccharothrix espanaensis (strain ATCC 51144 / DSM 44229 / JCM 9112 / NBRC 15066 / NRRL 15764) TaxID=1179773 RepID=K0KC38_SACES|nr:hypothetical protein [Saccharothrix espanaensis]CCH34163.1 hypothetical protein BN6_69270 [Saccharothrix espanaensis DSM 44229]
MRTHTRDRTTIRLDALAGLFPHQVATATELIGLGLPNDEVTARCRPGGEWQHLLPGVLLLSRKPPNRPQWMQAALRHAGPHAQLTGVDALQLHGMRAVPVAGPVRVLSARPVDPSPEVGVTRIRVLPPPVVRRGFLTAPLTRAAADAVRALLPDLDAVRAVLTEVVRRGGVPVADLARALARGAEPAQQVLADLAGGVRTVPQAWARALLSDLPLPPPTWHVELETADGVALGTADAWWPEPGLVWQLTPNPDNHRLIAAGIAVAQTTPQELRQSPTTAARTLHNAHRQAANRPAPRIEATRMTTKP